jgi:hypothetical protein
VVSLWLWLRGDSCGVGGGWIERVESVLQEKIEDGRTIEGWGGVRCGLGISWIFADECELREEYSSIPRS